MTKKLVLFLFPVKVRKIIFSRYDILEIEKKLKYKVEVHELINFFHPGFGKSFLNNYKNKNIKSFNSLNDWKKRFFFLLKKYDDILVVKEIQNRTLNAFIINMLLKKSKVKILEFPTVQAPIPNTKNNFFEKVIIFTNALKQNPKKITNYIKHFFFVYLEKIFDFCPDFLFKSGSQSLTSRQVDKRTKVLLGNSFDFNISLKSKAKKIDNNYGLFLESPTPLFAGDSYILGVNQHHLCTPEKWFKSLDNFFNFIEKTQKVKIKIAPHPKVKHKSKRPEYYYGREVINENLCDVVKHSKFLISRTSTGLSFAAINSKPAIFIYTNEYLEKKNNFLANQKKYASELGSIPINIDELNNYNKIKNLFKYNKKIYKNYKDRYLTSRNDKKINYQIIGQVF